MAATPDSIQNTLTHLSIEQITMSVTMLVIGLLAALLARRGLQKVLPRLANQKIASRLGKISFYLILLIFITMALQSLGFSLGVLLGAAGIFSAAIAFAAQTSVSNMISGLFLIIEKPFKIGDSLKIGSITGKVHSIDLLSIKLQTFDNTLVRVPSEAVIKSQIINLSHFNTRRAEILVGVGYDSDLGLVKNLLLQIAADNVLCLAEPEPLVNIIEFADSAIKIQFLVWSKREDFRELKNTMRILIQQTFADKGVEIPYPQVQMVKQ